MLQTKSARVRHPNGSAVATLTIAPSTKFPRSAQPNGYADIPCTAVPVGGACYRVRKVQRPQIQQTNRGGRCPGGVGKEPVLQAEKGHVTVVCLITT